MNRLRWKLLASMLAVVAVTGVVSGLFTRRVTHEELRRIEVARRRPDLRPLDAFFKGHHTWRGVEAVLDRLPQPIVLTTIALTNGRRQVIAASKSLRGKSISVDAGDRVTVAGPGVRIIVTAPPERVGDALAYVLPDAGPPTDTAMLDRRLVGAFAAAMAGAIALALLMSRTITRPVEKLTAAVDTMARGAMPARVDVAGRDEIARLARSFNAMADALARQQELRRRMVGDVAHELRTPLTNLRGELEAIQDGLASADAPRIASLHEEVVHLGRLVDDLQELAVAEAGGLELRREEVDLGALVARTAGAFGKPVRVTVEVVAEGVVASVDPVRIAQVVRNLLSNALRHARSSVRIEVGRRQAEAIVRVIDDGDGIPPAELTHVFERFYRLDDARARSAGGAGLGLAIVRQLVELHGGRTWAENGPAGGAVLTFTIPFREPS